MLVEGFVLTGLCIGAIAFLAEYVDSALGMGYGTTLTPILLMMGYEPMQVVPAVLLSELVTGLLAAMAHHVAGNANFRLNPDTIPDIAERVIEAAAEISQRLGQLKPS